MVLAELLLSAHYQRSWRVDMPKLLVTTNDGVVVTEIQLGQPHGKVWGQELLDAVPDLVDGCQEAYEREQ